MHILNRFPVKYKQLLIKFGIFIIILIIIFLYSNMFFKKSTNIQITNDYNQLIDLTNFQFTKLSSCTQMRNELILLVIIHSAPLNVEKRNMIRKTWGSVKHKVKVVFLLGKTLNKTEILLLEEQAKHGDLVQGNFMDTYKNLTYKNVMGLKFATHHCNQARYVLKVDDDTFVNIQFLLNYLHYFSTATDIKNLIMCNPMYTSPVLREGKWGVAVEEYADIFYPPYCSGYAILYSSDVVQALYKQSQFIKYFWIDDVVVTGIIRQRTNCKITELPPSMILSRTAVDSLKNTTIQIPLNFLYGPINVALHEMQNLWEIVSKQTVLY